MEEPLSFSAIKVYAGWIQWAGEPEFILIDLAAQPAYLDRPGSYRFRVPLEGLQHTSTTLRFRAGELKFDGNLEGDKRVGEVQREAASGRFELYAVTPHRAQNYAGLIGDYQPAEGGLISLGQDLREAGDLYFYIQGDCLTRLYPVGLDRWLSERGEMVHARRGADGSADGLVLEAPSRAPIAAQRVTRQVEEPVSIPMGAYQLAGTLLKPLGPGPFPAVVLCHLANTHRRDYYRLFAQPFVEKGFAVLIYDKRGWGSSTGEPQASDILPLAEDAVGAYAFLRGRSDIRGESVGFWGISNGSWVAPLAAARVDAPAFVICASAASVSPGRQEQIRRVNVVKDMGASPRAVALIDRLWGQMFRYIADGQWTPELESLLTQVYADAELQALPPYPGLEPDLQAVPPRLPLESLRARMEPPDPMVGFDPLPVYLRLACPLLFVWGDRDDVIPLDESLARAREALRRRGNPRDSIQVYPGATHLLYRATTQAPLGLPVGVMETEMHHACFEPGVREAMAAWAAAVG